MKNAIAVICSSIYAQIKKDKKEGELWGELFDAYNAYQESQRDGADYIFDLKKQEDILCCVKGGMTASEIATLVNKSILMHATGLFMFGHNHETAELFITHKDVMSTVLDKLEYIIADVIAYPWVEEYRKLYTRYVTNFMIDNYEIF